MKKNGKTPWVFLLMGLVLTISHVCLAESLKDGILITEDCSVYKKDGSEVRCERRIWFTLQEGVVWCDQKTQRMEIPISDIDIERTFGKSIAEEYRKRKKELTKSYRDSEIEKEEAKKTAIRLKPPPLSVKKEVTKKKEEEERKVPKEPAEKPVLKKQKGISPPPSYKAAGFRSDKTYKRSRIEVSNLNARIRKSTESFTSYDLSFTAKNLGPPAKATVDIKALDGYGATIKTTKKEFFLSGGQSLTITTWTKIRGTKGSAVNEWRISGVSAKEF